MVDLIELQVTAQSTWIIAIVLLFGVNNVLSSECDGSYTYYHPNSGDVIRECRRVLCTYGFEARMCEWNGGYDLCEPCKPGTFQNQVKCSSEAIINNPSKLCKLWTVCSRDLILKKNGTATNDTVCVCDVSRCYYTAGDVCNELQKCSPGFTLPEDFTTCQHCPVNTFKNESGCGPCNICTTCENGIEKNCTNTNNTVCFVSAALSPGLIAVIVVIVVIVIVAALVATYLLIRRNQSKLPSSQDVACHRGKVSCCGKCYICLLPSNLCRCLCPCCHHTQAPLTTDPLSSSTLIEVDHQTDTLVDEVPSPTANINDSSVSCQPSSRNMADGELRIEQGAGTSTSGTAVVGDDHQTRKSDPSAGATVEDNGIAEDKRCSDEVDELLPNDNVNAEGGNSGNSINNSNIGNPDTMPTCSNPGHSFRETTELRRQKFLESHKPKMCKKYADSLMNNGHVLISMTTGTKFRANLRKRSTLTWHDNDKIKKIMDMEDQAAASEYLLHLISEKDDAAFELLVESLVFDDQLYLANLLDAELCKKYKKTQNVPGLSKHDIKVLNEVRSLLVQDMICDEIFLSMCLKPDGFLTRDMKDRLKRSSVTKENLNGDFLDYFECWTDNDALEKLIKFLNDSHQEHLAEQIRTACTAPSADVQEISESLPQDIKA